jgi:hypothetical protein
MSFLFTILDKFVGARLCCDVPATIYSDIGTDVLLILKTEEALDPGYEGFELFYKTGWNKLINYYATRIILFVYNIFPVDADKVIPTVTQVNQ